ncbi:MAG: hypothetical protein MI757_17955 [Pirellulales bacterium]|nr:hypothetical protein [Pirellulales bacterium]
MSRSSTLARSGRGGTTSANTRSRSLTRGNRDISSIRQRFADSQRSSSAFARTRATSEPSTSSDRRSSVTGGPSRTLATSGRDRAPGGGSARRGPSSGIAGGSRDRGPGAGTGDRPSRGPGGSITSGGRDRGPGDGRGRPGDRRDGPYGDLHHKDYAHKGHGHKGRYYGKDYYYKDRHHHHYYDRYRYRPYWWVGLLGYGLGYLHGGYYGGYYYSEPYYYGSTVYAQPYAVYDVPVDDGIVVPEAGPEAPAQVADGDLSEQYLIAAEDAFRAAKYDKALRDIQHALLELPGDGRAILFLSQALLATGRYQAATSAAYQGMSLLDEKDWGFVAENYDKYYGNDDYVAQMKKLGEYIKANPKSAYAYALRGYHWGFLGYPDAARKDLAKAVELEPRDEMAARLLKKFGGKVPEAKPEADVDEGPALPPPPEGEPPLKLKGDS